jgi:hypothetical protein
MTSGTAGGYGEPVRVQREPDSKALVVLARRWVFRDPTVAGLALLGGLLAGVVSCVALVLQGTDETLETPGGGALDIVVVRLAAMIVALFTALALAAFVAQVEGRDVSSGQAWGLLRPRWVAVLAWLVTSSVLVIGVGGWALNRLGPGGPLLFLLGFAAWWLFTAYALPAVVLAGELPHRALATSVRLARDTFSFTIGANVRALLPWLAVAMGSLVVEGIGIVAWDHYRGEVPTFSAAGLLVALLGQLGFSLALAMQSTLSAMVNLIVLRHDRGLRTPGLTPYQLPTRWAE